MPERLSTRLRNSLGLTTNETKVYLAALEIGSGTMTQIAKRARMARTSAYSVIEHLCERGIILEFQKGKQALYVATAPEKLVAKMHEQEDELRKIVPELTRLGKKNRFEPSIRVLPGEEGMKTVLREIVAEKRPFRAMTSVTDLRLQLSDYFDDFIENRAKNRLKVHLLTNRNPYSLKMQQEDGKMLRVTRFLPTDEQFHTATYIFGDKVAWIGMQDEPLMSVVIEDAGIAKTHALAFDLLWANAEVR